MTTVASILKNKSSEVIFVSSDTTVLDAIRLMSDKNIGAVPVVDGLQLSGIFSERDYARKIILQNRTSSETNVSDIMTFPVITVSPDDSLDHCMEIMSTRKIRHLPVLKDDLLIGIISIGDVVSAVIQAQKETINHLQNYIAQ